MSEKKGGAQFDVETKAMLAEAEKEEESKIKCCCGLFYINSTRGGRLNSLLKYDFFAFLLSVGILILFCVLIDDSGAWDGYDVADKVKLSQFYYS